MFTKTAPIKPTKKNGHHPAFSGRERADSSFIPSVQTKLEVGEPNSIYEIEADRMANHVVGGSSYDGVTSFIAPAPVQTATKTIGPTTEKDPDILIEGILPPRPQEENEVTSDAEPEENPQEEKPETAEPSVPDESIEKPAENKEVGKTEKAGGEGEEKEEEVVPEAQKEEDISAEDAAAFQSEANLEPVAPIEITPELSTQFIQTKPQEVQLTEETEPEEDSENIQEKIQAKFAANGNEDEETGTVQRNGIGEVNASSNVEQGIASNKTGGNVLPPSTKGHMESKFGADFSNVRIHTDGEAQTMNNELRARAFTHENHIYFNKNQYNPTSRGGQHLLAHELTHTLQQGASVQRKPQITRSKTRVQKLGIGDALDYFADKANNIPGYRMFTIILGVNPINMSSVDRSAGNIIRAMVEFLPGGKLITDALDEHGIFSRVSSWFKEQMDSLSITGSSIRSAINEFLDSLSWSDIFNLGDVWRRAKRIFTTPIKRLISFAKSLVKQMMDWVKEAILRPLAVLAEGTPAYDLLRVVLGKDPITGDAYPPTAENLIGGFMTLIGQEEVWENIKKGNAIERAFSWFKGALSGLMDFVTSIPTTIIDTLKSLTWQDIILVVGAFQKIGKAFLNVAGKFMSWAGGTVLELLEIIFSVVAPAVVPWLKKAGGAFSNILQNPIGFVGNLVQAAKQGFMKFAANIGKHLKQALINWLMGSLAGAGVYIPQSLSIKEIIKFVLSVLGISWANLRIKLVKHLGEPAVKALETGFELVTLLVTKGPLAMWERIKEQLTDLKAMVIGEITSWVVTKVVTKAITKLVTSLNPAGAVIQAILFIYDTVTFLIDKIAQIAQVGMAVLNSMIAIASGAIGAAVQKVEQTLAGMLSLAISFLVNFLGLGKISKKIVSIVKKVQKKVDNAIDKVIGWIVGKAKAFLKKIVKKDDDSKHAQYAAEASTELGKPSEHKSYTKAREEKETKAKTISAKYNGKLKKGIKMRVTFDAPNSDMKDQDIDFTVVIAPNTTQKKGESSFSGFVQEDVPQMTVEFNFNPKAKYAKLPNARAEYEQLSQKMEAGARALTLEDWAINGAKFLRVSEIRKGIGPAPSTQELQGVKDYQKGDNDARESHREIIAQGLTDEWYQEYLDSTFKKAEADLGYPLDSAARHEFIQNNRADLDSKREKLYIKARKSIGKKELNEAATHATDKVGRGFPSGVKGLGPAGINSSIGSQLNRDFGYKKDEDTGQLERKKLVQGESEFNAFFEKLSDADRQRFTVNIKYVLL